ncbi:MAG: hypothetical protein U0795_02510 [Pirellulales bacterium]
MFRTASCVLLLGILGCSLSSGQAAIIESNDPRYPGTANTTIDTATNLEWLDWPLAKTPPPLPDFGWDIETHLKPGGLYEGWRLASYSDLSRLLRDVGLGVPSIAGSVLQTWTADWDPLPIAALDPFVYRVPAPKTASRINRNYETCLDGTLVFRFGGSGARPGYTTTLSIDHIFAQQIRYCGHTMGYMLVRQAHPVPEPSGLAMWCVMVPALVRRTRRCFSHELASTRPC